ncbi:MAG TPA: hypothetical protein VG797_03990 [Phycisphaerales bacterium]|nr:hypothetical protein [Phycisphaerales bacterium]
MPFIGSFLPAGSIPPEKRERRVERDRLARQRPGEAFERAADEVEFTAEQVDSAEGLRNIKPNVAEEAHEDRTEHSYYKPDKFNKSKRGESGSKLDLKG